MGKLFVKLWVFILLTSASSFFLQKQISDWTTREAETTYRNERIRRTFMFVEEALRPYPQAEWPTRFDVLAQRMGSSQSRVAKMETGDPSVSLDLIVHAFFASGGTRNELQRAFGAKEEAAA